jgi:hypothetical protein
MKDKWTANGILAKVGELLKAEYVEESVARQEEFRFDLEDVMKDIRECEQYWNDKYAHMDSVKLFCTSTDLKDSWGDRYDKNRPQFHVNQIMRYIEREAAELRKNPPGIKIYSSETMDVDPIAGAVRFIENQSGLQYALADAYELAKICGVSFIKMQYDEDEMPNIKFKAVRSSKHCYLDPESEELDGSDARYGFFRKEKKKKNAKGETETKVVYQFYLKKHGRVFWCHIDDGEIVDEGEYPMNCIPIFQVVDDKVVDGEGNVNYYSTAERLMDPQKLYDYALSKSTEQIAMMVNAPIVVSDANMDREQEYADMVSKPKPVMFYKSYNEMGLQEPAPQRLMGTIDNEWAINTINALAKSMSDITGFYEAAFGNDQKEASGTAIELRQKAASWIALKSIDHLSQTLTYIGKNVVDYVCANAFTGPSFVAMAEDGRITQIHNEWQTEDGQYHRLKYDRSKMFVTVDVGKSYSTLKQEFVDKFMAVAPLMGESLPNYMDFFFENLDFPGSRKMAQRAHAALPLGLRSSDQFVTKGELEAAMAQISNLTGQLAQATDSERIKVEQAAAVAQINANAGITKQQLIEQGQQGKVIQDATSKMIMQQQKQEHEVNLTMLEGEIKAALQGSSLNAQQQIEVSRLMAQMMNEDKRAQTQIQITGMNNQSQLNQSAQNLIGQNLMQNNRIAADLSRDTARLQLDREKAEAEIVEKDFNLPTQGKAKKTEPKGGDNGVV